MSVIYKSPWSMTPWSSFCEKWDWSGLYPGPLCQMWVGYFLKMSLPKALNIAQMLQRDLNSTWIFKILRGFSVIKIVIIGQTAALRIGYRVSYHLSQIQRNKMLNSVHWFTSFYLTTPALYVSLQIGCHLLYWSVSRDYPVCNSARFPQIAHVGWSAYVITSCIRSRSWPQYLLCLIFVPFSLPSPRFKI